MHDFDGINNALISLLVLDSITGKVNMIQKEIIKVFLDYCIYWINIEKKLTSLKVCGYAFCPFPALSADPISKYLIK